MANFGFTDKQWQGAKKEARDILITQARAKGIITYTTLSQSIHTVQLEARDIRLFALLGEISTEEDVAGRGMLSVLVVRMDGGGPGDGFFELARTLGRDTTDRTACEIQELKKVYASW